MKKWTGFIGIGSLFLGLGFLSVLFILLVYSSRYSGFTENYLLIDPRYILLVYIAINLFLRIKSPVRFPRVLYKINLFFILPLSIITVASLTLLELVNYPNFVYSLLLTHYDKLSYVLFASGIVAFINAPDKWLKSNLKKIIFLSAPVLFLIFFLIQTWPMSAFEIMVREDGFVEYLQFFSLIISGILSLLVFKFLYKKKEYFLSLLFFLITCTFFFIAGDEISWGQRIMGINSPDYFLQSNVQREITIHNLAPFSGKLVTIIYIVVGLYGSLCWTLTDKVKRIFSKKASLFIPPWYTSTFFFFGFIYNFYTILGDHNIGNWSEPAELSLYFGAMLFVMSIYLRLHGHMLNKFNL